MTAQPARLRSPRRRPIRPTSEEENVTTTDQTADHTPPARDEFCHHHFSWLCQAGQGKCQAETGGARAEGTR